MWGVVLEFSEDGIRKYMDPFEDGRMRNTPFSYLQLADDILLECGDRISFITNGERFNINPFPNGIQPVKLGFIKASIENTCIERCLGSRNLPIYARRTFSGLMRIITSRIKVNLIKLRMGTINGKPREDFGFQDYSYLKWLDCFFGNWVVAFYDGNDNDIYNYYINGSLNLLPSSTWENISEIDNFKIFNVFILPTGGKGGSDITLYSPDNNSGLLSFFQKIMEKHKEDTSLRLPIIKPENTFEINLNYWLYMSDKE